MSDAVVWALNLDADHELKKPLGYAPSKRVSARVAQMQSRIALLVRDEDVVLGEGEARAGAPGVCWCPTPTALLALERAGARPLPSPPLSVLQQVNHRRFHVELGVTLDGCRYVEDEATLREAIAAGCESEQWVMKRPFSISGSGRRVLRRGLIEGHDEPWVRATLAQGGVVLEPWVDKDVEIVVHGYVHRGGGATLGRVCRQDVDKWGAWLDTVYDPDMLSASEEATMIENARQVADALEAAGYFGPFGLDAFRYRRAGGLSLNARSEINARYTMGWALGMRPERPDLSFLS